MSHDDFSKRVHYLKCEERGYQEMCDVSERVYNEGIEKGKLAFQKETAGNLSEMGM